MVTDKPTKKIYVSEDDYWIFRPKQTLIDFIGDNAIVVIVCKPMIWSVPRIGTGFPLSPDEFIEALKLLFLVQIKDRRAEASEEVQSMMDRLLGEPPYNLTTFDRWWSMEKTWNNYSWDQVRSFLTLDMLDQILPTSTERIDKYMRMLVD